MPPTQGQVGNVPAEYLKVLNQLLPGHFNPKPSYNRNDSLNRFQVRTICRDLSVDALEAYAVVMAWGGQRHPFFSSSVVSPGLFSLLGQLRLSQSERAADFERAHKACLSIPGLGISFYTKLLYFFRPNPDAYILDQWTAKSATLLFSPCKIVLNGDFPSSATTTSEYEWFCDQIDKLALRLWPGTGATGEAAEMAIFDEGYGRGAWRNYVLAHFPKATGNQSLRQHGQNSTAVRSSIPANASGSNSGGNIGIHYPFMGHKDHGQITLSWTDARSYIKATHPKFSGNIGNLGTGISLSLTNKFINNFNSLKVTFDRLGASVFRNPGSTPHGGSNYYKTKELFSKNAVIDFFRNCGFSVFDRS